MVLSTDDENVYFLQHAEEAVRILNVDCREGLEDPANFPQKPKIRRREDDVAKAAGTYGTPNRGEGGVEGKAKEEGGGQISAADKQAINEAMALYPGMKMDPSSAWRFSVDHPGPSSARSG
ncbi:hypothetical protein LTR35_000649 [Friedmanniomyces endolithicus]|nr:hypothetical protein LTS00_012168 [Friedmanniomyces endolithicus]KAK0292618.1 hypothetical protein LTR35_000649 [Friedmanniomyces endolithicus]KAK1007641.1 hypothetical protein LTR54_006367 [Friedmanniomyces endolithicus]